MSLLLIVYFQFFSPTPEIPEEQAETEQVQPVQVPQPQEQTIAAPIEPDSLQTLQNAGAYGPFAEGATGTEEQFDVETEVAVFTFNTKGGNIEKIKLKDFLTYRKEELVLLDANSSKMSLSLIGPKVVDLKSLHYSADVSKVGDTTVVTFALPLSEGTVMQTYRLPADNYKIAYSVAINGFENFKQSDAVLQWDNRIKNLERDVVESRIRATINYFTMEDGFDGFGERSSDYEEESLGSTKWAGFKQHFFTSAIIAENKFSTVDLNIQVDEADTNTVKVGSMRMQIPASDLTRADFSFYFGPNNYQLLKKVTPGFDKNVYLGWPGVNIVNKYLIIPIFNFLSNYIGNYGIIIIILVLIIKLVLSPLSYKSYLSMAKTKVLKPELDEIKSRHPDDMQKQQQEQMKLYQQVGVNPLSGCIPLLLQMPILFAMFYFFPSSIELRQESFLWADDLSTYDSVLSLPFSIPLYGDHVSLFVLLMTASTILYTWSNNQMSSVQGPMKSMSYMMPVIFMFVLNSFPAALSFYYFVANLVTFGQQAIIRRFVDEEKILAILNENRLKNKDKKKSKFQQKLEQAMKASEEAQKTKKKK